MRPGAGWMLRFWAVLILGCLPSLAQLSPGKLSQPHAELDGPGNCAQCHEFGVSKPSFKCSGCHQGIRERLEQGRGYHARKAELAEEGRDCVGCHLEHYGRDYEILYFPDGRAGFDHRETGYPLKGKHATLKCAECHNAKYIPAAELARIQVKDTRRTLLGLPANCLGCHADEHRGQLSEDCASCHSQDGWKNPPLFDHNTTRFALTGRHEQTECAKCHKPAAGPGSYAQYNGIAVEGCQSCHEDPHEGAFTQTCKSCHTTSGWKVPGPSGRFDHSETEFPLAGKHASVGCRKCHAGLEFSRPVAHAQCSDCHADDPHKGQFRSRPGGGDCAPCHNEEGFKPSLFGVPEHQRSSYPLEGKHLEVKCAECHRPDPAGVRYRMAHESCGQCHRDRHGGQFTAKELAGRCDACHQISGFRPSTYSLARHEETEFPIDGAHRAVACTDCHAPVRIQGSETARYRFDELACTSCHENPHGDQFRPSEQSAGWRCTRCHTDRSWRRLTRFDHDDTSFPLAGGHTKVGCLECHQAPAGTTGVKRVVFRAAPEKCQGCHEDPHAGQFDTGGVRHACSRCHTNVDWSPTQFDHQRYSRFSLKGAHEKVACRQCHENREVVGELAVTIYRGTPRECADCHGPDDPAIARLTR